MLSKCPLWLFFFLWPGLAHAGDSGLPIGARSRALGQSVVALSDQFAVVNNIAGIAGIGDISGFASYHSYYGFEGLSTLAFGAILPVNKDLAAGFSVQRFGDKLYNELSFGVGAGHRINRVSLGVRINYRQIAVNAPSLALSKKALVVEMGGIAQLSSTVYMGAHVYNLTRSGPQGESTERVPTILKVGLAYLPTSAVKLTAEMVKDTDYPASVRAGLEYEVVKQLFLRTGIATKPYTTHFGMGFKGSSFSIDYAFTSHPQLGASHHFTLGYLLSKNKEPGLTD